MSSTNPTVLVTKFTDVGSINSNIKLLASSFISLTILGDEPEPFFPDPLACRLVNPLAVNHAINVSLSNGVSDLVYIVAHASTAQTSLLDNFNECM